MSEAIRDAASVDEVKERINKAFEELYRINATGDLVPYVCLVCDKYLKARSMQIVKVEQLQRCSDVLCPGGWNRIDPSGPLAMSYTYIGDCGDSVDDEDRGWIEKMLLSPRGCFLRATDGRRTEGFPVCRSCKYGVDRLQMPKFAIANNYCFGAPPACLLGLTEVELAYLTPVKTFGYCFTYTGGVKKQLKGSLSYYKVKMTSIARTAAQFDVLGLNSDIVVILHGKFTAQQRRTAREKNKIRPRQLMVAVEWLLLNNEEWKSKDIDMDRLRQELRNPVLIDQSREVEGNQDALASNIESTETFEVYFPDGYTSTLSGGQENLEHFQELVRAAQRNGYDLELRNEFLKEAVHDFKDNNLVNACLLQFPYGRGGLHETRLKGDGSATTSTDIEEYLEHLSLVAQPQFHQELFCLILYNMFMKQQMVKTAGWRVRGNATAAVLAEELTQEDVDAAISARANRTGQATSTAGREFLNAIDSVARSVPHSSESAKRACRDAEAYQHLFGMPSMFLTVAPDDDNSILVQILLGIVIDDDEDIGSLSDDELASRAKHRTSLRLKYPGISAYYFELALEIIIRDVIGWDLENHCPTEMPGLMGIPEAVVGSVEEQGRATLHAHLQVWVPQYNQWREQLHSSNCFHRRVAKRKIEDTMDRISSTALFSVKRCRYDKGSFGAFPHPCTESSDLLRNAPVVVDDQMLRCLRHRFGQNSRGKMFAYCPNCTASWTNEEFVESYLMNAVKVPGLTGFPDTGARRLKAMAVQYQKDSNAQLDPVIIDAAYNHHVHTKACFARRGNDLEKVPKNGTKSNKRKHTATGDECRFRHPFRKKSKTVVQNASLHPIKWYYWDGTVDERHVKEVYIRRHQYDVFQNVCCPAVTHSKLTCNSNISALMPGPIGQYTFKYNIKDTQKDDIHPYARVSEASQKALSAARSYESNRSESIRRLLSASHAHQKSGVLHGTMGSYLVRNKTRFIFSHRTTWCPYRDFEKILTGGKVFTTIVHSGQMPFFQTTALHYLCRPLELENVCAHNFYAQYEVVKANAHNREHLLNFSNETFQHPSYRRRKQHFLQGVQQRERVFLVKVFQYDFPDTAEFGGGLLDPETPITEVTELYCKLALLLFYPFRTMNNLLVNNSYTLKFREAVREGVIGTKATEFLQNIEDARSNCFRLSKLEDDLQRNTDKFEPADVEYDNADNGDDKDEEGHCTGLEGPELDHLLTLFDEEVNSTSRNITSTDSSTIPQAFKLDTMHQKGVLKCGYDCLAKMNSNPESCSNVWETMQLAQAVTAQAETGNYNSDGDCNLQQKTPEQREIGRLLLTRTSRRRRTFKEITQSDEEVEVLEANGCVKSILDWAAKASLDEGQKRAFEIFAGSFVLTFYSTAPGSTLQGDHEVSLAFSREKRKLEILTEKSKRDSDQLICLLHGPGGCGKTTVIDLLLEYAREYSSFIEGYTFTSRTIVVTAMSGVAATLLLGETTHAAVYLNKKRSLEAEDIELWTDTRLLIVDEISFASKHEFLKLHKNLCRLKQQLHLPYGGLNIIFAGDFRQLEPCGKQGKKAVYHQECQEFKDWVNCYLELKGMHRFRDDEEWGQLLLRFRNGEVTIEDVELINERVVVGGTTVGDNSSLPDDIKYATYFNRDRDAINAALFEQRCERIYEKHGHTQDSLMIFSDDLKVRNSTKIYTKFNNSHAFWESCGEDDVKTSKMSGRMDPVLKIYRKCRVMLAFNKDVRQGQANGTQAEIEKVILKPGVVPEMVMLGGKIPVAAVRASQVHKIVLQHCNDRVQPRTFCVEPRTYTFTAKMLKPRALRTKQAPREAIWMKANQLPLLINNATTGHKLQGSGVDALFVHNWSKVTNWVYVMLSRVKTRAGLFCRKALDKDLRRFAVPEGLSKMLQKFERFRPTYWSEEEYEQLFGVSQ